MDINTNRVIALAAQHIADAIIRASNQTRSKPVDTALARTATLQELEKLSAAPKA